MKTPKKKAASFFNITLPNSWEEMTLKEKMITFKIIALNQDITLTYSLLFCHLANLTISRTYNKIVVVKKGMKYYKLKQEDLAYFINNQFKWMFEMTGGIGQLDQIHKKDSVNVALHGVSYGDYLQLENAYQGFLATNQTRYVNNMIEILYPGIKVGKKFKDYEIYSTVYWWASLKLYFSKMFPHLFTPAEASEESPSFDARMAMDAQLKILTNGDLTKENIVLESDCWRALTYLNDKALESKKIKEKL